MAEQKMYKGRPLKAGVDVKIEMIDGKEQEILVIPNGMKDPYADGGDKKSDNKKTVKPNPAKDKILNELLEVFQSYSKDDKIFKATGSKFSISTNEGKWFTLSLTANKSQPKDLTEYNPEGE